MEGADPERSARPAPAPAGTLGLQPRDAQTAGDAEAAGRPAAEPGTGANRVARTKRWPRLRRVAAKPAARQCALLLFYIAAGIAVTWPRGSYLTRGLLPESRDSASYTWGFWWVAKQVIHLHNPWYTGHMAAPVGVDLGFHTLMPLPSTLLIPLTLGAGPGASYNLMVAIVPGLLCYAMYRAARLWLRPGLGAFAAGLFFGLSSMLTQQNWYHINIAAGALFLPLALEASVRLRRKPGRRQAIILGLVMAIAVLTDQESAVLAAIVVALALLPWLLRQRSWEKARMAALAVGVGCVLAIPQVVAMIQEIGVGHLSIPPPLLAVSYKQYGIGLPGMFTPTPRVNDFWLGALAGPFLHGRDNEGLPMFGSVLTVLAIGGLIAVWRRRSAWQLGALWIGCCFLALGTSLWIGRHQYLPLSSVWNGVRVSDVMPYTWFVRIPGLSSFREADRLAILGLMPAALLAGAAVEWVRYHVRPRVVRVVVIVLVAALASLELGYSGQTHPSVGTMSTTFAVDKPIAADHSDSVVTDIPFGLRGGIPEQGVPFFPQALVMATQDGHPRSVAYTSRVPRNTINAVMAHPFYADLITIEHQVPRKCPWSLQGCWAPIGVFPWAYIKLTTAQLAQARRDATGMHVGWAVVWKRNTSVQAFIIPYLRASGFRFDCRQGNTLVYRHTGVADLGVATGSLPDRLCSG
jgi:hypothetical protein